MHSDAIPEPNKDDNSRENLLLRQIDNLDRALIQSYPETLVTDNALTRKLVSFQANKDRAYYKWYKYKEAFSADLVVYLLSKYNVLKGKILDPFAGSGTALFACAGLGYDSDGIEVLPIGQKIITANVLARGAKGQNISDSLEKWLIQKPWNTDGEIKDFQILRITAGAYPKDTHRKIGRYLSVLDQQPPETREILLFALLCVLESISYTRKDGQYLRWDYRSGRRNGKRPFDKGRILPFDEAIASKLDEIRRDMAIGDDDNSLFSSMQDDIPPGHVNLLNGSCLDVLPKLESGVYSGIMTSPPYCNRYDYTRTYALEHALLGVGEVELAKLRQAMLSCTVENRAKKLLALHGGWQTAVDICDNMPLLQGILTYLDEKKAKKELNNNGIARMVRGYFYEMACVIQECYRVLDKDGAMFMVNDNVRYAGASISVDIILSKVAQDIGFRVEKILVLPQGKGNSSQQMGKHGRQPLRKCVYVWKKG